MSSSSYSTPISTTIISIETIDGPFPRGLGYAFRMSDSSKNIICTINNDTQCCEVFGVHTASVMDDFIGAEFLSMELGEEKNDHDNGRNVTTTVMVFIRTSRGKINLTFYNEHNGYYTHTVSIQSELIQKMVYL